MHINVVKRYYFISTKLAQNLKNLDNSKYGQKCRELKTFSTVGNINLYKHFEEHLAYQVKFKTQALCYGGIFQKHIGDRAKCLKLQKNKQNCDIVTEFKMNQSFKMQC